MSYFYKSGSKSSSFKSSLVLSALLLLVAAPKLCAVPQGTPPPSSKGNAVVYSNSPIASRDQAWLLDTYVGFNVANWQVSYGQESEWWSPNESGPLLFSDNAFPVRMFHLNRVSLFHLPGLFKLLGPMCWDAFFGTLARTSDFAGPVFSR
jgi:hypothetical protein